VRIEFGEPLTVHGRGAEEHRACLDFIQSRLRQWGVECEPAAPRSALTLDK
jgi:hypothetical protein